MITAVWSSYGHRFMSTDSPEDMSCLRCGGMWRLVPDEEDATYGRYESCDGSEPVQCPGAEAMWAHGYPGERYCEVCDAFDRSEPCEHESHDCNCLFCNS